MPKVSVIVPVYNVSAYIERCVRSLFEQTLTDMEFIFVDDCTPDDSISILQGLISQYPEREPFVKIVAHKENLGLPTARKSGFEASSGEYVIYCDSDDWVDREMYSKMLEKAIEEDADMVISGYCESDGVNTTKICHIERADDIFRAIIADKIRSYTWNKLVRRSIYSKNIVFPKGNLFEDIYLSIQLAGRCQQIAIVDKPLYFYFQNPAGICLSQHNEKKYLEAKDNLSSTVAYLKDNGFADKYPAETRFISSRITSQLITLPKTVFRKYSRPVDWNFLFSSCFLFKDKAGYITNLLGIHGISRYFSLKQWKNLENNQ